MLYKYAPGGSKKELPGIQYKVHLVLPTSPDIYAKFV